MAWRTRESRGLFKLLQHVTEETTCSKLRQGSESGLEETDSGDSVERSNQHNLSNRKCAVGWGGGGGKKDHFKVPTLGTSMDLCVTN